MKRTVKIAAVLAVLPFAPTLIYLGGSAILELLDRFGKWTQA